MEIMDKNIKYLNFNLQDIDVDWNKINTICMKTAGQEIGLMKKKNEWFNEECHKAEIIER